VASQAAHQAEASEEEAAEAGNQFGLRLKAYDLRIENGAGIVLIFSKKIARENTHGQNCQFYLSTSLAAFISASRSSMTMRYCLSRSRSIPAY